MRNREEALGLRLGASALDRRARTKFSHARKKRAPEAGALSDACLISRACITCVLVECLLYRLDPLYQNLWESG